MDDKKVQKTLGKAEKKRLKAQAKLERGQSKQTETAPAPAPAKRTHDSKASPLVHFAEGVRGVLFLILSVSLVAAIILGQQGYIITLDDIFESMVLVWAGKIVLGIIAVAFFIIGLKLLRAVK